MQSHLPVVLNDSMDGDASGGCGECSAKTRATPRPGQQSARETLPSQVGICLSIAPSLCRHHALAWTSDDGELPVPPLCPHGVRLWNEHHYLWRCPPLFLANLAIACIRRYRVVKESCRCWGLQRASSSCSRINVDPGLGLDAGRGLKGVPDQLVGYRVAQSVPVSVRGGGRWLPLGWQTCCACW